MFLNNLNTTLACSVSNKLVTLVELKKVHKIDNDRDEISTGNFVYAPYLNLTKC